jgi:hypothetical protein
MITCFWFDFSGCRPAAGKTKGVIKMASNDVKRVVNS